MARLSLTLLGGFQARCAPSGRALRLARRKNRALLAYLGMAPGRAHARESLTALLWGDLPADSARNSFRQALFALRSALPKGAAAALRSDGDTIALEPAVTEVDVHRFEHLVAKGTPAALDDAVKLYLGDFLAGLRVDEPPFEEWLVAERERLRSLALRALDRLLAHHLKTGADERALDSALRLLAIDPLQEAVHRTVIRLQARRGRHGSALRQYQTCVDLLERELGIEPGTETRELYQDLVRVPRPPRITDGGPGPRRIVDASPPERKGATPFVGRGAEMEALRSAMAKAREGVAAVVAVLGEAGMGKTRLVTELAREAGRRHIRVLLGHAFESEEMIPFAAWMEALRQNGALTDPELLDRLGPACRTELGRLFPDVGTPPAAGVGADTWRRLFEAIGRLVEELASRGPLLLILEDLHWADELSLRLVAFIARRAARCKLMLVLTARAEEVDPGRALWRITDELGLADRLLTMTLEPLDRSDTRRLVEVLISAADRPAVDRIAERVWSMSHGNPFVVTEAIREGGAAESSAEMPLPQRVRDAIARRLDRLGDRARHVAEVASVVGRPVQFPLLATASELGDLDGAAAVEELIRRRVLDSVDAQFRFTHERVRDVAYGALPKLRRQLLHARVAAALELHHGTDPEPPYAILAHHSFRGEAWEQAVRFAREAARSTTRSGALREAVAFLEQALESLDHLSHRPGTSAVAVQVRFDLRNLLEPLGEVDATVRHLREALTLAEAAGDDAAAARACSFLAHALRLVGEPTSAVDMGERALAIVDAHGAPALRAQVYDDLGQAYMALGDTRQGVDLLRRNVDFLQGDLVFQHFGKPGPSGVWSRVGLALALGDVGEFREALAMIAEASRVAASARPGNTALVCLVAGMVRSRQGDIEGAIVDLQRGLDVSRSLGLAAYGLPCAAFLGHTYALCGRVADGSALLEEAIEDGPPSRRAEWTMLLGDVRRLAGAYDAAETLAQEALTIARAHRQSVNEARALLLLAEIASHRDPEDITRTEDWYRQAWTLSAALGLRPLVAHCHLGLGGLHRRRGRSEQAHQHLADAAALYRAMEMPRWSGRVEQELQALR